jgi:hypothetical protein
MKAENHAGRVNNRRTTALIRLKEQLVNFKRVGLDKDQSKYSKKTGLVSGFTIPFEKEVERMKKEIIVLESRVMNPDSVRATRTKKHGFRSKKPKTN